jgi:tRNA A22 N-methylase
MGKSVKKVLREEYNRLKKTMEKIIRPKKEESISELVLQPVHNKKYLRGNLR